MLAALRRAARALSRSPAYAATSIGSIAIGLALATATFALVDAILHPQLPFARPEQVFYAQLRFGNQRQGPTIGEQVSLLREVPALRAVEATWTGHLRGYTTAPFGGMPLHMTPGLWSLLGVPAAIGRLPDAADAKAGNVALVRQDVWRRDFGNRSSIDGATVRFNDRDYNVVGVLPMKPALRMGGFAYVPADERTNLDTMRASTYIGGVRIVVRLRDGATVESAKPDLDRVAHNLTRAYVTGAAPPYRLDLVSARPTVRRASELEYLFIGLAIGMLAIACTNVAALSLARARSRQRDTALRRALGASRRAVAGEVLAEVGVLAFIGSVLGFGLCYGLLGAFATLIPVELTWTWIEPPVMNVRVFGAAAAAMLASIALAGGFPAWRASTVAPNQALKDGAGTTTGRGRSQFRVLVIAELAMAMVLLMMANLMSLSIKNRLGFDFGFDAEHALQARLMFSSTDSRVVPPEAAIARQRTLEIARAMPGVRAAALMGNGRVGDDLIVSDRSAAGEPTLELRHYLIGGAGVLDALGVRVIEGRDFVPGDVGGGGGGGGAVILGRRAAAALFPRGGAVGRTIKLGPASTPGPWIPIVGVSEEFVTQMVADRDRLEPVVLVAASDQASASWQLQVRASGDPRPVARDLAFKLRDAMPPQSRAYATPFLDNFEYDFRVTGFFAKVFGALGFAALALAAVGLFGVLSYVVGQRSREFAVRVALGASTQNVVRVVMRSAMEFALGGTAIGALVSFWASAGVSVMLFGVKNTDPVSLVITEATLIAVCLLAALAPALRAARANPLDIIRAV